MTITMPIPSEPPNASFESSAALKSAIVKESATTPRLPAAIVRPGALGSSRGLDLASR
jgi:hypothetical protein